MLFTNNNERHHQSRRHQHQPLRQEPAHSECCSNDDYEEDIYDSSNSSSKTPYSVANIYEPMSECAAPATALRGPSTCLDIPPYEQQQQHLQAAPHNGINQFPDPHYQQQLQQHQHNLAAFNLNSAAVAQQQHACNNCQTLRYAYQMQQQQQHYASRNLNFQPTPSSIPPNDNTALTMMMDDYNNPYAQYNFHPLQPPANCGIYGGGGGAHDNFDKFRSNAAPQQQFETTGGAPQRPSPISLATTVTTSATTPAGLNNHEGSGSSSCGHSSSASSATAATAAGAAANQVFLPNMYPQHQQQQQLFVNGFCTMNHQHHHHGYPHHPHHHMQPPPPYNYATEKFGGGKTQPPPLPLLPPVLFASPGSCPPPPPSNLHHGSAMYMTVDSVYGGHHHHQTAGGVPPSVTESPCTTSAASSSNEQHHRHRRRQHSFSRHESVRAGHSFAGWCARLKSTSCYWRLSKHLTWWKAALILLLLLFAILMLCLGLGSILSAAVPSLALGDSLSSGRNNLSSSEFKFTGEPRGNPMLRRLGEADDDAFSESSQQSNNNALLVNSKFFESKLPFPRLDTAQDFVVRHGSGVAAQQSLVIGSYDWALLRFVQPQTRQMRFNVSTDNHNNNARLQFYGRREQPPTSTAYDFVQIINGGRTDDSNSHFLRKRSIMRNSIAQAKKQQPHTVISRTFTQILNEGVWYFALCNENAQKLNVELQLSSDDDEASTRREKRPATTTSLSFCSGHGEYRNGQCQCDSGWSGNECHVPLISNTEVVIPSPSSSLPSSSMYDWKPAVQTPTVAKCSVDCGEHGQCQAGTGQCMCEAGYYGVTCSLRTDANAPVVAPTSVSNKLSRKTPSSCGELCAQHGTCMGSDNFCVCDKGWNGRLCTFAGCPNNCSNRGQCRLRDSSSSSFNNQLLPLPVATPPSTFTTNSDEPLALQQISGARSFRQQQNWQCECDAGYTSSGCERVVEICNDGIDNDNDGFVDCRDNDCCGEAQCRSEMRCLTPPEPHQLLLREAPLPETATFFETVKFLLGPERVQLYINDMSIFNANRASVIRGRVIDSNGIGLVAVRVAAVSSDTADVGSREQSAWGLTLTRQFGWFDFVVNGGGSLTLSFVKDGYLKAFTTVAVGWNEFKVAEDVVLTREGRISKLLTSNCSTSTTTTPLQLSTFQPSVIRVPDSTTSSSLKTVENRIFVESQILQQTVRLPGMEQIPLLHQSNKIESKKSLLLIRLLPNENNVAQLLRTLVQVELHVSVAGVVTRVALEPTTAGLHYMFVWNGLNAYGQTVYGEAKVSILVKYRFGVLLSQQQSGCDETDFSVVERHLSSTLHGHDLTLADIGGWNLPIHHRLDTRTGILYRGDGGQVQLKFDAITGVGRTPTTLSPSKTEHFLPWVASSSDSSTSKSSVHAVATAPDGSIFYADLNVVRQVLPQTPSSDQTNRHQFPPTSIPILELPMEDAIQDHFYLAVSPVDGSVYVALPRRRQILKIRQLATAKTSTSITQNPKTNFIVFAGTGEQCNPTTAADQQQQQQLGECGDLQPALSSKLFYPKTMAIDRFGNVIFADGTALRLVNASTHIIKTVVSPRYNTLATQWNDNKCLAGATPATVAPAASVAFVWPNSLVVNPLDELVYFIDDGKIFRLTEDFKFVELVAVGDETNCATPTTNNTIRSDKIISWPKSLAFSSVGSMIVLESNSSSLQSESFAAWRIIKINQQTLTVVLDSASSTPAATAVGAMAVTKDDRLILSNFRSVQLDNNALLNIGGNNIVVYNGAENEKYTFNQYGQHLETRQATNSDATGPLLYRFTYTSGTQYRKLDSVKDATGMSMFTVKRNYRDQVEELRTAGGAYVFDVRSTRRSARLNKISLSEKKSKKSASSSSPSLSFTVEFEHDEATGLILARNDNSGMNLYKFDYDATNGRLTRVVYPTGAQCLLKFDENNARVHITPSTGDENVVDFSAVPNEFALSSRQQAEPITIEFETGLIAGRKNSFQVQMQQLGTVDGSENHFSIKSDLLAADWIWHSRQPPVVTTKQQQQTLPSSPTGSDDLMLHQLRVQNQPALSIADFGGKRMCIHAADLSAQLLCATRDTGGKRAASPMTLVSDVVEPGGGGASDAQFHFLSLKRSAAGRVYEVRIGDRVKKFAYTRNSLLTSIVDSNAAPASQFSYDGNGLVSKIKFAALTDMSIVRDAAGDVQSCDVTEPGAAATSRNIKKISHKFGQVALLGGKRRFVHEINGVGAVVQDYDEATNKLVSVSWPGVKRIRSASSEFTAPKFQQQQQQTHQSSIDLLEQHGAQRSDVQNNLILFSTIQFNGQFGLANLLPLNVSTTLRNRSPWQRTRTVSIGSDSNKFEQKLNLAYDFTANTKRIGPFSITRNIRNSSTSRQTIVSGKSAQWVYDLNRYGQVASKTLSIGNLQVAKVDISYSDDHAGNVELVKLQQQQTSAQSWSWTFNAKHRPTRGSSTTNNNNVAEDEAVAYDYADNVVSVSSISTNGNFTFKHDGYQIENFYSDRLPSQRRSVTYDADGFTISVDADAASRRQHGAGVTRYGWNNAGQLISATTGTNIRYDYDHRGRLLARSSAEGGSMQLFYTDSENWQRITHYYEKRLKRLTAVYYDDSDNVIALDVSESGGSTAPATYLVLQDPSLPNTIFYDQSGKVVHTIQRSALTGKQLPPQGGSPPPFSFPFNSRMEFVDEESRVVFRWSSNNQRLRFHNFDLLRFMDVDVSNDLRSVDFVNFHWNPYYSPAAFGTSTFEIENVFDYKYWLKIFGYNINEILPSPENFALSSETSFAHASSSSSSFRPTFSSVEKARDLINSFSYSHFFLLDTILNSIKSIATPISTPATLVPQHLQNEIILRTEPYDSSATNSVDDRMRIVVETTLDDNNRATKNDNNNVEFFTTLLNGSFIIPFTVSTRAAPNSAGAFVLTEHANVIVDLDLTTTNNAVTTSAPIAAMPFTTRFDALVTQARRIYGDANVAVSDMWSGGAGSVVVPDTRRLTLHDPSNALQFNIIVFSVTNNDEEQRERALARYWTAAHEQLKMLQRDNPTAIVGRLLMRSSVNV